MPRPRCIKGLQWVEISGLTKPYSFGLYGTRGGYTTEQCKYTLHTHLHVGMVFFAVQSGRTLGEATEVTTSGGAIFHLKQHPIYEAAASLLT